MYVIDTYLKFMPKLIREKAFKEMMEEKMILKVDRYKVKIRNPNQSIKVDKMFSDRMEEVLQEERKKHFWYNRQIPEVENA